MLNFLRQWLFNQHTKQQLYQLTDYQLRDIGITRNEISYRAREATEQWFKLYQS